jgi:hypothetical protein
MLKHGCCLKLVIRCLLLLSLVASGPITAWAYEVTPVSNGGTVAGTVQFALAPAPTGFELRRYPTATTAGPCQMLGAGFCARVAMGPARG